MSLTSYQAAPPRVLDSYYGAPEMERKRENRFLSVFLPKSPAKVFAAQSVRGQDIRTSIGVRNILLAIDIYVDYEECHENAPTSGRVVSPLVPAAARYP